MTFWKQITFETSHVMEILYATEKYFDDHTEGLHDDWFYAP